MRPRDHRRRQSLVPGHAPLGRHRLRGRRAGPGRGDGRRSVTGRRPPGAGNPQHGRGGAHPSLRPSHGKVAAHRELHLRQRRGAPHPGRRLAGGAHGPGRPHCAAPGPGQDGPHAHQIVTSPDGDHVLAVDLGNDSVYTYRFDEHRGTLDQVSCAAVRPGAGPRHITFHPGGRFAYLACEVDNTAVVCGYDPATGILSPGAPQSTGTGSRRQLSRAVPGHRRRPVRLPRQPGPQQPDAIRRRGRRRRTAAARHGARRRRLPRQIAFSPDGKLLFAANQRSSTVTVFRVDARSGGLTRTGGALPAPVAVCVLPYPSTSPVGD